MNPKLKLTLVLAIPVIGIALRVFSLFALLSPADVASDVSPDEWSKTGVQNTWLIKDIIATTGQTITTGSIPRIPKWERILKIAMPIWLYNESGWRPLLGKLQQQWIKPIIITNTWDQRYEDFANGLFTTGSSWADIILLHNDQLDNLSQYAGSFGFSQDISWLFPYVFFSYLQNKEYTFFPFAIDPLVSFAKNAIEGNVESLDRDDVVNGVSTSTEDDIRKLAVQIPILFWISPLDIQLIKNKKEAFVGYTDVLRNIIYQSSNRSDLIENIKRFSDERLEDYKFRDYAKYKRISTKLTERNAKCWSYPDLCFMFYKLTSFRFGYLSDLDIMEKYFQKSDYRVYNFPNSSSVYPVRLRWWVVNKSKYDTLVRADEDGTSLAWLFFQEYITQSTNGNQFLRPTLFSAFNVVLEQQSSDLQRKYVTQYKKKRQVNPITIDTNQRLEQILALLQGDYDIKVFLASLVR